MVLRSVKYGEYYLLTMMNVNSAGDSAYHFHLKVIFTDKQVSNTYLQLFHGQRRMSWTKYLTRWLSFIIGSISRSNFCHESLSPRQFSYHTEIPYLQAHSSTKSWCKNYYILLSSKINVLRLVTSVSPPKPEKKMNFKKSEGILFEALKIEIIWFKICES